MTIMKQIMGYTVGKKKKEGPGLKLSFLLLLIIALRELLEKKNPIVVCSSLQCFVFERFLFCMCLAKSCTVQFRIR